MMELPRCPKTLVICPKRNVERTLEGTTTLEIVLDVCPEFTP